MFAVSTSKLYSCAGVWRLSFITSVFSVQIIRDQQKYQHIVWLYILQWQNQHGTGAIYFQLCFLPFCLYINVCSFFKRSLQWHSAVSISIVFHLRIDNYSNDNWIRLYDIVFSQINGQSFISYFIGFYKKKWFLHTHILQ